MDVSHLLLLSSTLLLFTYGVSGFSTVSRDAIRNAVIGTKGRTLVMHRFEGLVEFSDLPDAIQEETARSKSLIERVGEHGSKPGVFNAYEDLFEA